MRINNIVTPEILVNRLWRQEEDTSGVKITELNSSSDSSKESTKNYNHLWSHVNDRFEEKEYYKINEEARRRRNLEENEHWPVSYANQYYEDHGMQSTNSFYNTYDADFNSAPMNHQMNCFTIINNRSLDSDSSDSDKYNGVKVTELDKEEQPKNWDHVYNDEVVNFEQTEKRTIWIYSYKNKRLLSENDFELVNIPSRDTSSTSDSITDEEQNVENGTTTPRVGSPIPAPYIPRLNLSLVQTLSTVTEITEPNKSHSKESPHEVINLKPINNWLTERSVRNKENAKKMENTNIVNWMALSPRERRRRSINTNAGTATSRNVRETEITYAEGNAQYEKSAKRSTEAESSSVQVEVDIHSNKDEIREDYRNSSINKTPKKIADLIPMKIYFPDADKDINDINTELDYSNRPSIQLNTRFCNTEITEPIEKLESNNWISEEKVEKESTVLDYDVEIADDVTRTISSSENVAVDSASRRLWMRNVQLMKGPQWTEYLPITGSPVSLHLSLSLSSLRSRKSWFKRLTNCLTCCK